MLRDKPLDHKLQFASMKRGLKVDMTREHEKRLKASLNEKRIERSSLTTSPSPGFSLCLNEKRIESVEYELWGQASASSLNEKRIESFQ